MKKILGVLIGLSIFASCAKKSEETSAQENVATEQKQIEPTILNAQDFAEYCNQMGSWARKGVYKAETGWRFLKSELLHLGTGKFWENGFRDTKHQTNIVRYIVEYRDALKELGVEMILVPIPPKASIYPEKLHRGVLMEEGLPVEGIVYPLEGFYIQLRESGVEVLDLEPVFRKIRKQSEEKLYCQQDSHFSPYACQIIAQEIVRFIQDREWLKAMQKQNYSLAQSRQLQIKGDLAKEKNPPLETITITEVIKPQEVHPFTPQHAIETPVILLGDSHTRVFSDGIGTLEREFYCSNAGLRDHLENLLGFPIDQVANNGSGSMVARSTLFRTRTSQLVEKEYPDYLKKKKLLIWCFSAREFTQEKNWNRVPVQRVFKSKAVEEEEFEGIGE